VSAAAHYHPRPVTTQWREREILERFVHAIAERARDAYTLIEELRLTSLATGPTLGTRRWAPPGAPGATSTVHFVSGVGA